MPDRMSDRMSVSSIYADVLVAGDGLSGRAAALECARAGLSVIIAAKGSKASDFILGFNAPIGKGDSEQLYIHDTLVGGYGISDKALVSTLAKKAVNAVKELEKLGIAFDRVGGEYDLLKPLGCSVQRLVHSGNTTGKTAMELYSSALCGYEGVRVLQGTMLSEILVEDRKVCGAILLDMRKKQAIAVHTGAIVLACGGVHISEGSTYPESMTGDGYAAAYRVGATLCDMEFLQFEPCRCIYPSPLGISTTLLAKGGEITNAVGRRFLLDTYPDEGSIPKDILSRLIAREIMYGQKTPHGGVYLDLTKIPEAEIKEKHSLYYKRFLNVGIDLTQEKIEVAPSAHSFMGGVKIDADCKTDLLGLFACGETSGGLHGANRVGGNAGSEVFVFGKICGQSAAKYAKAAVSAANDESVSSDNILAQTEYFSDGENVGAFDEIKAEVRKIMREYMSPVRSGKGLGNAVELLCGLEEKTAKMQPQDFDAAVSKCEAKNLLTVSILSCRAALKRSESRGVHYREDFPCLNEEMQKSIQIRCGKMQLGGEQNDE